ncbi:glutaredoxin domain-containing cysteine-rich protein 2 [Microcaecilia unicolor]|uniref:Glutaredoxin domain-containing cysteine-rich protein 2 n=1 Tax=Microcaecilia unicolor TaxID=1415580 RepID=A0A6P7YZD4_9AMPH|nr:glutaredoxin domain-containing cysteine-rich protein 2 [Microcaecilia unicolor]
MEDLQRKLSQGYETRPRKVRFKISSAYSGRVLKQVFEDGQELELPEEYPHSFIHRSCETVGQFYGVRQAPELSLYPSAKLTAQKISVFRDRGSCSISGGPSLFCDYKDSDQKPSEVLDLGKIIIYTNNLKIVRTPKDKEDLLKKFAEKGEGLENASVLYKEGRCGEKQHYRPLEGSVTPQMYNQYAQVGDSEHRCLQCRGSGCAPCSLCHGSKFSMLANRFKESYRALRCPACNENGLQPCQTCAP